MENAKNQLDFDENKQNSSKERDKIVALMSNNTDTFGRLSFLQASLEEQIERHFADFTLEDAIQKVVDYGLFSAGKRLRPILSLALFEDLAPKQQAVFQKLMTACPAIEFLHCASLIHDDLPALDNDDMRRGKPACHKAFGEASAILAGDILVPMAFKLVTNSTFSDQQKISFVSALSTAYIELCQGQQLDLLSHSTQQEVTDMQRFKTGSLFAAACSFSAIALDLGESSRADFYNLGLEIGALYQIYDDYLDLQPDTSLKGRAISSDVKNNKFTLATSTSPAELQQLLNQSKALVESKLQEIAERYGAGDSCCDLPLTHAALTAFLS